MPCTMIAGTCGRRVAPRHFSLPIDLLSLTPAYSHSSFSKARLPIASSSAPLTNRLHERAFGIHARLCIPVPECPALCPLVFSVRAVPNSCPDSSRRANRTGAEFDSPGIGVLANFSSYPRSGPSPAPDPPALSPPPWSSSSASSSVSVSSLTDLLRAAADPTVATAVVTAPIAFNGTAAAVRGAGRALTVRSHPTACSVPTSPSPPSPSRCSLDARGLSRLFDVGAGALLRLENLELRGGSALQGGSVLAVGAGSRIEADGCLFADTTAIGDGGAVLALGGAQAAFRGCARAGAAPSLPRRGCDAAAARPLPYSSD